METANFQVLLEYRDKWPDQGPLQLNVQFTGEVTISPNRARQRVAGYLASEISMALYADTPVLVIDPQPTWHVPIRIKIPSHPQPVSANDLFIEVNAATGEMLKLSTKQLSALQAQLNAQPASSPYSSEPPR